MQIFFGACLFFVAVVLLAYVPGKLLLLSLKRRLSPLEDVTLACFLGLIVSGLAYWLITFTRLERFYLIWPLTTAAVFLCRYGSKIKSPWRQPTLPARPYQVSTDKSRDGSGVALAAVVALGVVVLAFLPLYYTNLTRRADGTMRVRPVPDVFLHIAIANELTHTVPPQSPVFSGAPLTYHYGMDVVSAIFCLQHYLSEHGGAWLFLSALLSVVLMEVKVFTAAQLMFSLGLAAVVYLFVFRTADLFKVAAVTAALAAPLLLSLYLGNKSGAHFTMTFDPSIYLSRMMEALGTKDWLTGVVAFAGIALPIYLVGCLGLRVIGVPAILSAIFRPNPESGLRFVLALFVVIGLLVTLTCRIAPTGFYNSAWFLVQSKYGAWIFAVEVLQTLYRRAVWRGIRPEPIAGLIAVSAVALSVPATVQHFALERDPDRLFGEPLGKELQSFNRETLSVMDFLTKDAQPGDVVLPCDNLLAPILALTKCRVPVGYFAYGMVARSEYVRRESAVKQFWKDWRLGKVQQDLLREAGVRYIVLRKTSEGLPATIPVIITNVFENSEFTLFKVDPQRLSETVSKTL